MGASEFRRRLRAEADIERIKYQHDWNRETFPKTAGGVALPASPVDDSGRGGSSGAVLIANNAAVFHHVTLRATAQPAGDILWTTIEGSPVDRRLFKLCEGEVLAGGTTNIPFDPAYWICRWEIHGEWQQRTEGTSTVTLSGNTPRQGDLGRASRYFDGLGEGWEVSPGETITFNLPGAISWAEVTLFVRLVPGPVTSPPIIQDCANYWTYFGGDPDITDPPVEDEEHDHLYLMRDSDLVVDLGDPYPNSSGSFNYLDGGIVTGGGFVWAGNRGNESVNPDHDVQGRIWKINEETGSLVATFLYDFGEGPVGITWDGSNVWILRVERSDTDAAVRISKIDPDDGSVLSTVTLDWVDNASSGDNYYTKDLIWDGTAFWVVRADYTTSPWTTQLIKVTPSGSTLDTIDHPSDGQEMDVWSMWMEQGQAVWWTWNYDQGNWEAFMVNLATKAYQPYSLPFNENWLDHSVVIAVTECQDAGTDPVPEPEGFVWLQDSWAFPASEITPTPNHAIARELDASGNQIRWIELQPDYNYPTDPTGPLGSIWGAAFDGSCNLWVCDQNGVDPDYIAALLRIDRSNGEVLERVNLPTGVWFSDLTWDPVAGEMIGHQPESSGNKLRWVDLSDGSVSKTLNLPSSYGSFDEANYGVALIDGNLWVSYDNGDVGLTRQYALIRIDPDDASALETLVIEADGVEGMDGADGFMWVVDKSEPNSLVKIDLSDGSAAETWELFYGFTGSGVALYDDC